MSAPHRLSAVTGPFPVRDIGRRSHDRPDPPFGRHMPPTFSTRERHATGPSLGRRGFLAVGAGVFAGSLAGCTGSPSSGGPPFTFHEVDDGPVFGPGLHDEREREFYAGLLVDRAAIAAFDRERLRPDARSFLAATEFDGQYLVVVQVSGVPASMDFDVADVAEGGSDTTVVASLDDRSPAAENRVVSTLLVRVTARDGFEPRGVTVEFHLNERHRTFDGVRVTPPGERAQLL